MPPTPGSPPAALAAADWWVLVAYAAAVVGLGLLAQRRQGGGEHFFLGGRDLPWTLVGASILATAFSASSLLGGPGEAWQHGLLWLQLQLGDLLAIVVVALLFIPFFRGLSLTTAYEYLERRFGPRTRTLAALLFQAQVLLRAGLLVYGPALALSTLTGIGLRECIVAVGVVATAYTLMGGITAVVWTDVLQLVVVLAGLGGCVAVVAGAMPGGLGGALASAQEAGRLAVVDPDAAWSSVRSLPGAVIGYGLLSLSVAGTNQQPVQRYLACRDVRDAQRAAFLGWGVGLLVTLLTLGLGALLFAFYLGPGALPEGLEPDAIFPHFVATQLPAGLAGLLVAAIFAAAMSSLDSALNSLATSSVVDLHARVDPRGADEHWRLSRARWHTLAWGALAIAAGLYVAGRGGLLAMAVRYMGYFAGPMLGLFLLGFLAPRVGERAALAGLGGSFAVVALAVNLPRVVPSLPPPGIWACAIGAVAMVVAGLAARGLDPPPGPGARDGLILRRLSGGALRR